MSKNMWEKIECFYCHDIMGYGRGDLYYLDEPICPECFDEVE